MSDDRYKTIAHLDTKLDDALDRIERLEAALREIAERTSPLNGAGEIARAALAKETGE